MSDDDDDGAPGDGPDEPVADPGPGRRSGRDGEPEQGGGDGVVVHPGHVMGMSGVMDGVAGRYEAAVKFLQSHGRPDGNGWTGLMEELKGPLAGAVDAFARRLQKREADARDSKGKFQDAARQYAGADAANAGALRLDVGDGSSASGDGATDAGGDVEAEDYPSADDVDFAPPEEPDSQQQEDLKQIVEQLSHSGVDAAVKKLTGHGLVEEILKPFVAHWPELVKIGGAYGAFGQAEDQIMGVVDSGRQRLAENWQGPAHDAADAHLKDRVGGGDAPIGHAMAELLTAVHDGVEQTISGLVDYLKDGLNQQGTYKGQPVTVAQLAANHDKLPPDVAQELQDPLTTFAQQALEYVQTGRQIVDQAKVAIGQIEAGDADAAAGFVGQAGGRWHQAAADISGEDEAQGGGEDGKGLKPPPKRAGGWSGSLTDNIDPGAAEKIAVLAGNAEDPAGFPLSEVATTGYRPLTDDELRQAGIDPADLVKPDGFQSNVFTDGKGHYVLGISGARRSLSSVPDDANVVDISAGGNPPQMRDGVSLTQKLVEKFGADKVLVTAHSMGGAIATAAAMDTGANAVIFQAQAPGPAYFENLGYDPDLVRAQSETGQIVHFDHHGELAIELAQESVITAFLPNPYGKTIFLPTISDSDDGPGPVDRAGEHSMRESVDSLQYLSATGEQLPAPTDINSNPLERAYEQVYNDAFAPEIRAVMDPALDVGLAGAQMPGPGEDPRNPYVPDEGPSGNDEDDGDD